MLDHRTFRIAQLVLGAFTIGVGVALMAEARLGLGSWTVLAQGVSVRSGIPLGLSTTLVTILILLAWIPLRVRPGLGTIVATLLIGPAIDVMMLWIPPIEDLAVRIPFLGASTALIALGTGMYLSAGLGPGARDGLMTGLYKLTRWPIQRVRTLLELSAIGLGWLLGGTVGVGTVVYGLMIGPLVRTSLTLFDRRKRVLFDPAQAKQSP